MELDKLPKLRDAKNKPKLTFSVSDRAYKIYNELKSKLNVDSTEVCVTLLEKELDRMSGLLEKK